MKTFPRKIDLKTGFFSLKVDLYSGNKFKGVGSDLLVLVDLRRGQEIDDGYHDQNDDQDQQ